MRRKACFFAEVDLAPEEVAELSANWNSRDLVTIRKLHGIKAMLHPTLEIWVRNSAGNDYDDVLTRWAAVLPSLP
ncbi:MAG TPA: hypothetical protein VFE65_05995 [Pseudonocardia sp.]|jgi:hypothetical protein|nr:hypothetical protein [Pseudonocardia sp.]